MTDNKELLNAQALASALGLCVDTIWRYTRENRIPCIELGSRQYRYRLDDVIKALSGAAIQENAALYNAGDAKKLLTYEDYLLLEDEPGYRFEIIEGMLIKEPSPNVIHQRLSLKLARILQDYFEQADPAGEVFIAPLDVTLTNTNVVKPDLFYISGDQQLMVKDTRIDGPPALAVEILSPSTSRKDRLQKMRVYQKTLVQHYWIVNLIENTLECFALRDGMYALVASGMDEDIVDHPDFEGLSIPLQKLWNK